MDQPKSKSEMLVATPRMKLMNHMDVTPDTAQRLYHARRLAQV
jgi:hypothetical protein